MAGRSQPRPALHRAMARAFQLRATQFQRIIAVRQRP
jgi:hypothetical protein